MDLQGFVDELQQALAHNTAYAMGGQKHTTKLIIIVKETSVDLLPGDATRADLSNWTIGWRSFTSDLTGSAGGVEDPCCRKR